jgi:hypothetical protein
MDLRGPHPAAITGQSAPPTSGPAPSEPALTDESASQGTMQLNADAAPSRDRAGAKTPTDSTQAATLSELVKQCAAAAAIQDCGAVRLLAQRIAAQDPAFYKAKVAQDAMVARCLAY